jgi:hypothetical protein
MVKVFSDFGGLRLEILGAKLVNMRCESSNMFQGHYVNNTL